MKIGKETYCTYSVQVGQDLVLLMYTLNGINSKAYITVTENRGETGRDRYFLLGGGKNDNGTGR